MKRIMTPIACMIVAGSAAAFHAVGPSNPASLVQGCAPLAYPAESLSLHEDGKVSMALLIGAHGEVMDRKLTRSSGHRRLDKAALAGMAQCHFEPAKADGVAQESWLMLDYVWKLPE